MNLYSITCECTNCGWYGFIATRKRLRAVECTECPICGSKGKEVATHGGISYKEMAPYRSHEEAVCYLW